MSASNASFPKPSNTRPPLMTRSNSFFVVHPLSTYPHPANPETATILEVFFINSLRAIFLVIFPPLTNKDRLFNVTMSRKNYY